MLIYAGRTDQFNDPSTNTGRYLLRCVHPGASITNLMHVAQDENTDSDTETRL
jgi:hypothetical protein